MSRSLPAPYPVVVDDRIACAAWAALHAILRHVAGDVQ